MPGGPDSLSIYSVSGGQTSFQAKGTDLEWDPNTFLLLPLVCPLSLSLLVGGQQGLF